MSAQESAGRPASVPLLDVARGNAPLHTEFVAALENVLNSGRFVFGPEVFELEKQIAEASHAKYGISCASGSDAILLALMAYEIGPGDEVIVPSFTFFATASAVWRLGAKPVFADIDPVTFNIDPEAIAAAITPNTKAIIPVHLFGQAADMTAINAIAAAHDLWVIEDACQAILSEYDGQPVGSIGDVGCFSFYPTKNLGGMGDGGMLTTNDEELAAKLRLYRGHGMEPRYYHSVVGINSRLDTFQAATLLVKMEKLNEWTEMRRENAARYNELFRAAGMDECIILPSESPEHKHAWNQYTVRVPQGRRDDLRKHLADHKIGSEVYYPVPLHQQVCFANMGPHASLVETEKAAKEVLSLPIFPELTAAEQRVVVESIEQFYVAVNKKAVA
ncbi:DegT/DnrJ/EryC1/StrS family aminotransferase [Blastopirellula sp. JC732]|uniref:DegT/DnrJ/EryC1/StrS family aminotransferase n=1 Tax=Blastopirellula sediminis TaxID=2894196 RepID=A0A9X1MH76_9BACT|nr:DegT/DnrJ/EryC1/StrS family aminotransferase [Blastopirellula sediminis]MCC9604399.1 DegT/DnrJ/EryC1/StrS family aminotransferase [Blastopirellula sediminis]MCC9626919.1 DegT/DnrJ/EryC1/StrS family aminotransferase [Blastopirellula sediminis]